MWFWHVATVENGEKTFFHELWWVLSEGSLSEAIKAALDSKLVQIKLVKVGKIC